MMILKLFQAGIFFISRQKLFKRKKEEERERKEQKQNRDRSDSFQ